MHFIECEQTLITNETGELVRLLKYLHLIIRVCVLAILAISFSNRAQADYLLNPVAEFKEFSPIDFPIVEVNEHVYFSQYGKSGNNFDVVTLNLENQKAETIVKEYPRGRFIAQSDKYFVISQEGRFAESLVVIDLESRKPITQKSLKGRGRSWAEIQANRLTLIQGNPNAGGGNAYETSALIFELPTLRLLKSTKILGGNIVKAWNGKILSLGYQQLVVYDEELNELFKIPMPPTKIVGNTSCKTAGPIYTYQEKAVIIGNCGEILVYDLPSRQHQHTIPSYANLSAVTVVNGLIFTAPISETHPTESVHVHDLISGKLLAVLPINATDLFAIGNRLLTVQRTFLGPSRMALYSVPPFAARIVDEIKVGND